MSAPSSTDLNHQIPPSVSSLHTEWSLLRALVCGVKPQTAVTSEGIAILPETVRWKVLLELADRHGVQPLLYQALSQLETGVSTAEMRVLTQLYHSNLHKALLLSRELIHIVDCLAGQGIEVLPYKGVALAEGIYGDMALRQAGDIDLLIHARDLPRITDVMRELGYRPHLELSAAEERAYLKSGYECGFDGAAGPNLLELQWAIQPRFYAVDFDQESLFQRAATMRVAGRVMKTPSPEDLFLILSVHAAKHVWGRLIWLCDIERIMKARELNWSWIGSQAKDLGIVRILRVTLLLASRLLNVAVPEAAETSLPHDAEARALADEIEIHVASGSQYNVESFGYFRLMLRLRENWRDRRRFVTRLAFTPGPGEWSTVRLPGPLFPLYRLVRFWRLASRLVRS